MESGEASATVDRAPGSVTRARLARQAPRALAGAIRPGLLALGSGLAAVGLAALLPVSCAPQSPGEATALPARQSVPLETVVFSGHRYVARVDIGSVAQVPLMIHGNSRMYLSVTHAVGEKLLGGAVPKTEDYGYSSRGKGVIPVKAIRIGGRTYPGWPEVPVFDFSEGDTPVQGMLGTPFLAAARAAVDFSRDRLLLGVSVKREPDRALLAQGYRTIPFTIGPGARATLEARFPAIGRTLPITPSTVSSALTLHLPLFAGKVPMTKEPSPDRSPNGTTPDEYTSGSVAFEIAGVPMHSPASFEDFAEYGKVPEGDLVTYGMLGYDWMKEHRAVLDYANRRLYFRP